MADEEDDIKRYRDGSLSKSEMHALEKKALSDAFLADALEGAETVTPSEFSKDLFELSRKIQPPQAVTWFTPLRIAAGTIVLLGAGSLFYFFNRQEAKFIALEKATDSDSTSLSPSNASGSAQHDSSADLITMVKPKKATEAKTQSAEASSTGKGASVDRKKPDDTKVSADAIAEIQQTTEPAVDHTQPSPKAIVEEEKFKVEDEKTSLNKKDTRPQPTQTSSSGAGLDNTNKEKDVRSAKVAQAPSSFQINQPITGQVTSTENGAPLPGVDVLVMGTQEGTVTDMNGNYSVPVANDNPRLVFSYIGMHTVEATPRNMKLDVKLAEDVEQLSEVVVVGRPMDADRRDDVAHVPVLKMAMPSGGIRAYNKYLEDNLRYPEQARTIKVKGKVTVQFTVTIDGRLNGFRVIRALGHGCDEEVIRLVKEGPAWAPTTQDDIPIESDVKVKLKFDPDKEKK